ncbi:MAG TPA: type II toxin-antitoxin system HigB family toxin [Saprospiraceae bacterium]|nr:type II toxin-antitoxin system HigB family toxin [Saprospiraceae bacterium]
MRVIAVRTLKQCWTKHPEIENALKAWYQMATKSGWVNHGQLKAQIKSASVLNSKRVVFNIKGNSYRLIVDIEYKLKIIFIVWIGTHKEYAKIDVKKIGYDKAN